MKKRIFTILLTSIILLAMIAPTAWAAFPTSGKCGDNLYWEDNSDTKIITISGTGPMYDYKDSYTSEEERLRVTRPWGVSHRGLIIEPGVTSIGNMAFMQDFSGNYDVSITLPDSITRIGDYAFWHCTSLTSIEIPDSVTSIGTAAFEWSGLTCVTVPSSITKIHHQFFGCENLTSIDIPLSVTEIGETAFSYTALKDIYYAGTKEQWEKIKIDAPNDELNSATIHYNSHGPEPEPEPDPITGFTDIPTNAYYADAVKWAVEQKITNGTTTTTFSPDKVCTRGEIVTFLWRAYGSPEPKSTVNPFADVKSTDYFYKAVLWAAENKITSGSGATTFSPNNPCSRAEAVTFLYRTAGTPAVSGGSSFSDVPTGAFYADAVKWAVEKGITQGTSATTFSPDADCSRAQIVTFLYRDMAE